MSKGAFGRPFRLLEVDTVHIVPRFALVVRAERASGRGGARKLGPPGCFEP